MPRHQTTAEIRLGHVSTCFTLTRSSLQLLVDNLKITGLEAILNTTQSLLKLAESIIHNKNACVDLMEHSQELLNGIIMVYLKSDTGAELAPRVLEHIGKFTQTLHKIHTFFEAQQTGNKFKKFFRQGELNALLKDCKAKLQQELEFFQIINLRIDTEKMQENAHIRHQEVLNIIETLSDSASLISGVYSSSYASFNSISMLPAEPRIFHGRETELADILKLFGENSPRIAILGAGGMGKTSLSRAVLHHTSIAVRYNDNWFFVACDGSTTNQVELAGVIGAHLGLKSGKDLTQGVLWHLSSAPPTLLILDNLETPWDP
ncbi:hypothetical protein B0H16DRAFT_1484854, partial [Mycena metata]